MGLFKSKAEKELDSIIQRLEMDLANNYKDNAQDALKELITAFDGMCSSSSMKPNVLSRYESIIEGYKEKMKGYSHKDQKPYWH